MLHIVMNYEREKIGWKKIVIILMIAGIFVSGYCLMRPQMQTDYADRLSECLKEAEFIGKNDNLSPNQERELEKYKKIIACKEQDLGVYSKEVIEKNYNACESMQFAKEICKFLQILLAVVLAVSCIGTEQAAKEVYQSLLMPWKRNKIYAAKVLITGIILCFSAIAIYIVSYFSVRVRYGDLIINYVFVNANGNCSTLCFEYYYIIQFLLEIIPAMAMFLLLVMIMMYCGNSMISILLAVGFLGSMRILGYIGEYMGYFWYNLVPLKSFALDNYFFRGLIVDEPEYFEKTLGYIVDHRFSTWIVLIYDMVWLIIMYFVGLDKFTVKDF